MSIVNDKSTPETDACWDSTSCNLRLHAQQLERERDEAITRRLETIMQCELYEQERDETMEALEKCREDSICYAEYMRRCGYSAAYKESQENADRATIILNKHKEGAE
jgi:hypothetical protein